MHRNQPQKALNLLKEIIENYSGSIFTNDALKLALFITRTSVGGLKPPGFPAVKYKSEKH